MVLIAPAIVLERRGLMESFGRSRHLIRGNGWPVFGVVAGVLVLQIALSAVLTGLVAVVADNAVGNAVASLLTNTLVAPLSATAAAVMFLELRHLRGEAPLSAGARPDRVPSRGAAVPDEPREEGVDGEPLPPGQPGASPSGGGHQAAAGSSSSDRASPPPEGGSPPRR